VLYRTTVIGKLRAENLCKTFNEETTQIILGYYDRPMVTSELLLVKRTINWSFDVRLTTPRTCTQQNAYVTHNLHCIIFVAPRRPPNQNKLFTRSMHANNARCIFIMNINVRNGNWVQSIIYSVFSTSFRENKQFSAWKNPTAAGACNNCVFDVWTCRVSGAN